MNQDRVFATHPLAGFALNAAEVSHVAAAVRFAVGVNDLTIESVLRDTESIIVSDDGRRVDNERHDIASRVIFVRNETTLLSAS